jgi:hypothetical protein
VSEELFDKVLAVNLKGPFASDASSYTTGAVLKVDGGAAYAAG